MKFFQYFKRESGPTKKEILRERFMNFVSELKVRGFSEQTIDAYLYHNGKFLDFTKKEQISITSDDIRAYLNYLVLNGLESRTINLAIIIKDINN